MDANQRIRIIDDSEYVLTLDYTLKMLNIYECFECGVSVVLEGETGVGKTALVEMLSKLLNQSLLETWHKVYDKITDFFQQMLTAIKANVEENLAYQVC